MRKSTALTFFGCLLIMAAVGLFSYNLMEDEAAGEEASEAVQLLSTAAANTIASFPDAIPDYELNPDMEMPIMEENNTNYVGTIKIPALDLELPVVSEWSYPNLKIAPCRYKGSIYTDDCIIIAHNYKTHFGQIGTLQNGDAIIFTDMDGNIFTYQVSKIEILEKTDFDGMNGGEWDLTLFTCTYGGQNRVTVRCQKTDAI